MRILSSSFLPFPTSTSIPTLCTRHACDLRHRAFGRQPFPRVDSICASQQFLSSTPAGEQEKDYPPDNQVNFTAHEHRRLLDSKEQAESLPNDHLSSLLTSSQLHSKHHRVHRSRAPDLEGFGRTNADLLPYDYLYPHLRKDVQRIIVFIAHGHSNPNGFGAKNADSPPYDHLSSHLRKPAPQITKYRRV
ncbi:uncharacterized protein BKA78DRAFT_296115 [Phyllosticta capitalensis]|uniref:uncharacterized protein n=1 Tax=Phyllosticta capitalensis TaxID=121624 RepID=UPI00312DF575